MSRGCSGAPRSWGTEARGLTVAYGSTLEPNELLPALGLMVIGAGLAAFGFWRYARRRSWWAEARGAAIRDYGSAPVYLRR